MTNRVTILWITALPDGRTCYRPQTKLWEGYVFTGVCDSGHGGSAPLHAGIPPPWQGRPPLCSACWEIRSTSGRYASYWNAILFIKESSQIFIAGKPYKPNDFHVVMETSISVTVQWKAGFAAGYGPQTFRLEYRNVTEKGTDNLICSWFVLLLSKEILWSQKDHTMPSTSH